MNYEFGQGCDNINSVEKNNKIQFDEKENSQETNSDFADMNDDSYATPVITLSIEEKIRCLEEIDSKLKKILYVYDESLKPNSNYNYKMYIGGVMIYISSSNMLFGGELVSIVINLNAIMTNKFSKAQIKRIVFESRNFTKYLLSNYQEKYDNRDTKTIEDL